ncbi:MAG: type IV toxin-antitoxin system AbiEi family antitoxin domain-containing protein [Micropruina sp.]|nr:type IV toxin-antitoxin system AbiEi family antitoxin domain-containing protein [Micropruina sp.]
MATAQQHLWEIALDHHGFVTTDEARVLGIAAHTLRFLARRGTLRHEAHGVYRFERFPASKADDYMQAVLWTGRADTALSHETALDLLELADVNPDRIHVTVPDGARVRRQGGERIVVHQEDLRPERLGWWEGIRCVTSATAIRQVIDDGSTQVHLIRQAIEVGSARGALTVEEGVHLTSRMEARLAR